MVKSRQCQNCQVDFRIQPEDFVFYKKIKVPAPSFCPQCRLQRRLATRNERSLYKRDCSLCSKDVVSTFQPKTPFPVYCHDCYFSDKWDAKDYGMDLDFSKPFLKQYKELSDSVPRLSLWQKFLTNSTYTNLAMHSKNVYLSFSIVHSEDVIYSRAIDKSKQIYDCSNLEESEKCYQCIEGEKHYNSAYLLRSKSCIDSWFLYDCVNCTNCILSSNLRNKEYVIRNKQYSKEDYFKELEKMNFGSYQFIEQAKEEFKEIWEKSLRKYADMLKAVDSVGDRIYDAKNAKYCFGVRKGEDLKYIFRVINLKGSMDVCLMTNSDFIYEYTNGGSHNYNMRFGIYSFENVKNADYTENADSSSDIFGCISVKKSQYCILNKQYSKEEYEELRLKIIKHMNDMPYLDQKGREYKYGEFFPIEFSPFAYNETIVQEYFPLTKEQASEQGYKWKDSEAKSHTITIFPDKLPDDINDVSEDILNEVIGCMHEGKCMDQCTIAFRLIKPEFDWYKAKGLPIPRLCPNCRYYERHSFRNPPELWKGQCMCDYKVYPNSVKHSHHEEGRCQNEFKTVYSEEGVGIVYCEQCYNAEVV